MFLQKDEKLILYFDQVTSSLEEVIPYLTEAEIQYSLKSKDPRLNLIRATQRFKTKKILNDFNLEVRLLDLGRPFVHQDYDLAYSHKEDFYLIGLTRKPFQLGVDLEKTDQNIDWSVFKGRFFLAEEEEVIQKFSRIHGKTEHFVRTLFFSFKEALSKAKDVSFVPTNFCISLSAEGVLGFSGENVQLNYYQQNSWIITSCLIS